MTRKIGLLGGTFDPPHAGHLALAWAAYTQLGLDEVRWLPVGQPTHKAMGIRSAHHRAVMTALTIADYPHFILDRTDLNRPSPHYTSTLLPILHETDPTARRWLLMGADSLRDWHQWHHPEQILRYCRLAVLPRPHATIAWELLAPFPQLLSAIDWLIHPQIDLSSTQLRDQLATGKTAPLDLHVQRYIKTHHLYEN